jgi:TetR/AcrR family fatty acid metabolism transcriptional regulator
VAGQREAALRADLPRKIATKAFFGVLDEMVTSWILGRKDYDLSGLASPVVDLFLRGLAAPGTARRVRPALVAVAPSGGK